MDNLFKLSRNEFGQMCLLDGTGGLVRTVTPVRAFPISNPEESIALVDGEGHELVWLNSLAETSSENQQMIVEELSSREFMPILTRIDSVSTFATPSIWDIETDRGPTRIRLKGEEDIRRLSVIQASILSNLAQYLKKGGLLVYSTCTIFREENEDVVDALIRQTGLHLIKSELINGTQIHADSMFIAELQNQPG